MFLENTDMCEKYFSIQRTNYICSLMYESYEVDLKLFVILSYLTIIKT